MDVLAGFRVGEAVGSGVLVIVGKRVSVGAGVSVDVNVTALQETTVIARIKNIVALQKYFIVPSGLS